MKDFDALDLQEISSIRKTLEGFGVVSSQAFSATAFNGEPEEDLNEGYENATGAGNDLTADGKEILEASETAAEIENSEKYQQEENERAANRANRLAKELEKTREEREELEIELTPEELEASARRLEQEKERKAERDKETNKGGVFGIVGAIVADIDRGDVGELPTPNVGTKQQSPDITRNV